MDVLHSCCCGLDVHKKSIAACVASSTPQGKSAMTSEGSAR
jgi:transposase